MRSNDRDAGSKALIPWVLGAAILVVAASSCSNDASVTAPTSSPTPTVQDIMEIEYFAPLESGTYSIDPDVDPSTPLRVLYEIPAEGWSRWIGAAKPAEEGTACSSSGCQATLHTSE